MDTYKIIFTSDKYNQEEIIGKVIAHGGETTEVHPKTTKNYFSNEFKQRAFINNEEMFLYMQCDSRKRKDTFEFTLHQSKIGTIYNTVVKLEKIFGSEFIRDLFSDGSIERLDVCVDTHFLFDLVKAGLMRNRVKITSITYSSTGRTWIIGGPRSNQVVIYEKLIGGKAFTRIEFRFRKNIPIRHLSEARDLLEYDWDSLLIIFKWDTKKIKASGSLLPKKLFQQSFGNNLIHTLYRYRKSGRFKKEILPCLASFAENLNWGELVTNELKQKYLSGFPIWDQTGGCYGRAEDEE